MSDRSVVDTVDAYAVEPQDYVRFSDLEGESREGFVLAVEDRGDMVTLVLDDAIDGDTLSYELEALTQVEILAYDMAEVA